ncbi:MAG: hypothetical protein AAF721_29350 [Myxococcota bacterium]
MLLDVHGWLPGLVSTQFENLELLFVQWFAGRRSAEWFAPQLARLRRRIDAHVDALILAGPHFEALSVAALQGTRFEQCAAAQVMVRSGDAAWLDALARVWDATDPAARRGLVDGLTLGPLADFAERLALRATGDDVGACQAAVVLRAAGHAESVPWARVAAWRSAADAFVREAAWRLVGMTAVPFPELDEFDAATEDEPEVSEAAYWAATVRAQPCARMRGRQRARRCPVALRWLAVLCEPSDEVLLRKCLGLAPLGLARYEAAASAGLPGLVDDLIDAVGERPVDEAVAAGAALQRMTGVDFRSEVRLPVPPSGSELFDVEDDVRIPDQAAARKFWRANRKRYDAGTRWAAGTEVSLHAGRVTDLRTRWEATIRGVYERRVPAEAAIAAERVCGEATS